MTNPRSGAAREARRMSTLELNRVLNGWTPLLAQDAKLIEAVRVEKDRRLSDPNSPDFRPTFF